MHAADANSKDTAFRMLDITVWPAFSSHSSRSFRLERNSNSLCPTRQLGWIDLHHPCDGHIKTQIRVCLPQEYHEFEKMREIVRLVLEQTGIAADETYEARFVSVDAATELVQSRDRHGYSDRI